MIGAISWSPSVSWLNLQMCHPESIVPSCVPYRHSRALLWKMKRPKYIDTYVLSQLSSVCLSLISFYFILQTYWKLEFKQPASEYLQFRAKLEENCVALENVVLKNEQSKLTGTIKVKNISFEKEVFVRLTDNNWQSYIDRPANYIAGAHGDLFDTFSFDFAIPMDDDLHQKLAFCVCYKVGPPENRREFWDSNGGTNFELISERKKVDAANQLLIDDWKPPSCAEVLASMNYKNWTEFASWRHVDSESPYWWYLCELCFSNIMILQCAVTVSPRSVHVPTTIFFSHFVEFDVN